ncbi:MAG: thioredoxin domain-containing protein, partial [Pseudomonadota bacterium]
AKDMEGKVKIAKIDVDQNPDITTKYGIQAMPTLILFKDGEIAARHTGALVQKSKLADFINENTGN